ncbi:MAG: hypothetical protein SF339_15890 [Blastocatellia bacterium]|nr:hypothetical protein [Blastocatellia bacterium]
MADTSSVIISADRIDALFQTIAAAVAGTQRELDATRDPAATGCQYAVPRVDFELEFALQVDREKRILFIPVGNRRSELHTHRLRFSLVAIPEPPPRLPADLVAGGAPMTLSEPHFLIDAGEEQKLCRALGRLLQSGDSSVWKFDLPGDDARGRGLAGKVREEGGRVIEALDRPHPERGMVCFRLDGADESYLIVRVTKKEVNDGLFLFTPSASPQITIYSIEDDGSRELRYEPLHRMAQTVRRWVEGATTSHVERPDGGQLQLGMENLTQFVQGLRDGYIKALRFLSGLSAPGHGLIQPTWYDLTGVGAELRFSVEYDDAGEAPRLNFRERRAPDGAGAGRDYKLIESRVVLRARRDGNLPRVDVELEAPEFVLSGRARDRFIELAVASAEETAAKFARQYDDDGPGEMSRQEAMTVYLDALRGRSNQRGAVIFLSYKGNVPQEEFLVIWPGIWPPRGAHEQREFVFTCKREGERLDPDKTRPLMRLDQHLRDAAVQTTVGTTESDGLDNRQYQAFHNFFHAVRIWRGRMAAR